MFLFKIRQKEDYSFSGKKLLLAKLKAKMEEYQLIFVKIDKEVEILAKVILIRQSKELFVEMKELINQARRAKIPDLELEATLREATSQN